jgi:hypothetical protein
MHYPVHVGFIVKCGNVAIHIDITYIAHLPERNVILLRVNVYAELVTEKHIFRATFGNYRITEIATMTVVAGNIVL